MSCSRNQNPDHHGGHIDELVEEAEEDERRDPGAWEQDEVATQDRSDRARRADHRDGRRRVDRDLGEARDRPAAQVEGQERQPAQVVLDVVAKITDSRLPSRWSQPP
jgi:hypothetical protein